MSDKEAPNEFADNNEFADDGVPDQPGPDAVADAVKQAIAAQQATGQRINLAPCPCGERNVTVMLDIPQGSKVGRATCGTCGTWGVDFLVPRSQDQNLAGKKAAEAWNDAPRA